MKTKYRITVQFSMAISVQLWVAINMRAIINNSNDELSAVRRAIKALQSVA